MHATRPYVRKHYRLAVDYPAMFSDRSMIGEGRVTNLSVFGCTLHCGSEVPDEGTLHVRLILPDNHESLPIEVAEVRWIQGTQMGLRFHRLERQANLRLHGFVWDRMLLRLQALAQQSAPRTWNP